jgi:hypothetical protein
VEVKGEGILGAGEVEAAGEESGGNEEKTAADVCHTC